MPEPHGDSAAGAELGTGGPALSIGDTQRPRSTEGHTTARGQPLKLVTSFPNQPSERYPSVSLLPTPTVATLNERMPLSALPPLLNLSDRADQRIFSSSEVPDSTFSLLHTPVASKDPGNKPESAADTASERTVIVPRIVPDLGRSDSLKIPKRGERTAQLARSGSVGSLQRQPTTVLHREREVSYIPGPASVPEEVYIASSNDNTRTAWKRVRALGKGSFSNIVLARPAIDYVKPEFRDEVDASVENEIARLGQPDAPAAGSGPSERASSLLIAVKITSVSGSSDPQFTAFKRDFDLMTTLPNHPSLLRMFGSSLDLEAHHRSLFLLPFCTGGDLFDLVSDHRSALSALLVRRIFADICSAVAFLHSNLVVHRDIKLENILLDLPVATLLKLERPDQLTVPLAKVTDLGLARRIDPDQPLLTTRCGSDDYVPPELMLGQPYDGRESDCWALGVLLYAIMEGRLPFDTPPQARSEGVRARLRTAHRIARVDWNWYKRRECPPEWEGGKEIVDNTLVRRKQRRSAAELLTMPWVAQALPDQLNDTFDPSDILALFTESLEP